jgi:hypothetical protein
MDRLTSIAGNSTRVTSLGDEFDVNLNRTNRPDNDYGVPDLEPGTLARAQKTAERSPLVNPTLEQLEGAQRYGIDPRYVKLDGEPDFPANEFLGRSVSTQVREGEIIDRWSFMPSAKDRGHYFAPSGTPLPQRA